MESNHNKSLFGIVKEKNLIAFVVSVLVFFVISWIYFAPNDFNGDVMQQDDMTAGMANGHEAAVYHEKTGEVTRWTDALFGGMPTFQISPSYSSSSILSKVASVYSLKILGVPDYVSWLFMLMLGFYILMLAFDLKWYYAVLGAVGYAFSSYFFIIMGAGHIWKLLTLCYIPPTIAGVVMCYRGKWLSGAALTALFAALQLMSNHVQMTYYSGFIIAALAIGYLCKAIGEKRLSAWAVATLALAVAGGLAIAANAPNLYLSNKYAKETMRGGHSDLTPVKGQKKQSETAGNGGLNKDYINMWSYGKGETLTLMVPNVKGGASMKPTRDENNPAKIVSVPMTLDKTSKFESMQENGDFDGQDGQIAQQCMQYFTQYFGDQPMTNGPVYVGALICALFLLGCIVVTGPVKWALLAVTILSILLSWGGNFTGFTDLFVDYFPLYNKFRTPSSILVIAEFTMPLLAVLGTCKMFSDKDFLTRHKWAFYTAFGITGGLCLLFALVPSLFGNLPKNDQGTLQGIAQQLGGQEPATLRSSIKAIRLSLVSSDAWRSLGFIVVGFAVCYAYLKGWFKTSVAVPVLAIAAVVLVDMFLVNKRYIDSESFVAKDDIPAVQIPATQADKQILKDKSNYRVLDVQNFMSATPSYYHKTVGGYHPAKLARYNDLIDRQLTRGGQLNIPQGPTGIEFEKMGVWNMLNTKYIKVDDKTVITNPAACGNAWMVDSLVYVPNADKEMAYLDHFNPRTSAVADQRFAKVLGQARPVTAGDTIVETSYAPNELKYRSHSAKGGVAVFSEIYFPWGWTATIDGKPVSIGRVNYVLRAMQVPAGDHTIVMTFKPAEVSKTDGIATGAIVAIFVLVLLAVGANVARWRRQSMAETPDKQ